MDMLQQNSAESTNLSTQIIDMMNQSLSFTSERQDLLEIILQYNELVKKIANLNHEVRLIKDDEMKANEYYDEFKKDFAQVIESGNWGEKLYYALPIYENYDDSDVWIAQWHKVVKEALLPENCADIRNFINRNLYSNVCSLPKDVYNYKVKSVVLKGISDEVVKQACIFASRTGTFFKLIKDFSEQLRNTLYRSVSLRSLVLSKFVKRATFIDSRTKTINIISNEEIQRDKSEVETIVANSEADKEEKLRIYYNKYAKHIKLLDEIIKNEDSFVADARSLYQEVLSYQEQITSLKKQIYTASLTEVYKLYDNIIRCISDFTNIKRNLSDTDAASILYCENMLHMLRQLQETIEGYLLKSYYIKPLKEIQIGKKYEDFDSMWYEVFYAEESPTEELKLCVSSITDTGFAKYQENEIVDYVTRTARISVYSNKVLTEEVNS